jgi:glycosyltransferase involved in cell wall biosynthesis
MSTFHNPKWINECNASCLGMDRTADGIFSAINSKLDLLLSDHPEASIIIAAKNEEANLLAAIHSIANNKTSIPIEVIVVDNNSTDRTGEIISRLHVKGYHQPVSGCGPARQLGLDHARGKYVLTADADCLYPEKWIDGMINELKQTDAVCVYGRYSFIANKNTSRLKLFIYEKIKDIMADIRHIKRPHMNSVGLSMGFLKEYMQKVGFVLRDIRGEDGRICFDLMKYGKVVYVKNNEVRVWTGTRALERDGSIFQAMKLRIVKELRRATDYFRIHPEHDTRTSKN